MPKRKQPKRKQSDRIRSIYDPGAEEYGREQLTSWDTFEGAPVYDTDEYWDQSGAHGTFSSEGGYGMSIEDIWEDNVEYWTERFGPAKARELDKIQRKHRITRVLNG